MTILYWAPVPIEPKPRELPHHLKLAIARRVWDPYVMGRTEKVIIDPEWASYFQGLADAGVEGAKEVLDAISVHGRIELWIDEE